MKTTNNHTPTETKSEPQEETKPEQDSDSGGEENK